MKTPYKSSISAIFPQPVYLSKLDRALTKEELRTIHKHKKKTYKNEGNTTSNDSYILENKIFKHLKKDLNDRILDYVDKVLCTNSPIIPYITQSWINYTETNQYHHRHSHSNAHISGVFYISANQKIDSIKFYKTPNYAAIGPNTVKYNLFNSVSWQFPVQTGDIFLFRSSLEHGVARTKGTTTRISLSFNVFFKGTLGNRGQLTELVLK